MTIAPSLHPPYNITGDGSKPLNWTVSLSWASPFFISVADSAGNAWMNGLLHSGEGSNSACLSGLQSNIGVSKGIAIGAGVGGLGVGLIIGLLGALFLCLHEKRKSMREDSLLNLQGHSTSSRLVNRLAADSQYQVEPFVLPSATGDIRSSSPPTEPLRNPSLSSPSFVPDHGTQRNPGQQVYVVHHDGGQAPVTVYTQEGAQVVELPPGYTADAMERYNSSSLRVGQDVRSMVGSSHDWDAGDNDPGRAEASVALQPVRQPGNIQKQRRPQS